MLASATDGTEPNTVPNTGLADLVLDVNAALAEVEPDLLWSWLSLRTAQETRIRLDQTALARALAKLQIEADRNRRLLATPVRKDLLLQDWLIQWARLSA